MALSPKPASRFTYIDALRGLAALWVAGHHFYPGISNHYQTQPFFEPFPTLMHYGNCGGGCLLRPQRLRHRLHRPRGEDHRRLLRQLHAAALHPTGAALLGDDLPGDRRPPTSPT